MSSGDRVCFLLKGSIISVHLRTCDINLLNQWPIKQVKSRKILTLRPCQSGWSVLPSGAIVTSGSGLLLRTIPGSVVLPHLGSGSMAHAATKGHTGLACNLWPCWCSSTWPWLEPKLIRVAYTATRGFGMVWIHKCRDKHISSTY